MSDNEIETPETHEAESEAPKSDDRKVAYAERDAAKKRARDAERKAAEYEARIAEIEGKEAAAAEEVARKNNDFSTLEAKLKREKEAAEKRAADAEARILARERKDREAALVDAVAAKLSWTNRTVLRGVMTTLAESGVDTAPETLDDKTATDVAKQVREALGDLYTAKHGGGSPGAPGVNHSTKPAGEKPGADPARERVRQLAKRMSIK